MGSANLDMGSLQFQSECHSARSEEPMQFAGSERVHRSFASLRMTNVLEPAYAEAAEHAPYRRLHLSINFAGGFVDGGQDQVLQHFDVAGFHRFGIDAQAE